MYSYNAVGGATKYWQCTPYNCSGSSKWEMTYSYNLAGDITSWIHPAGYTFTHTVNTAQRVTRLSSSLSDGTHPSTLADLTYAAHGAVATLLNGCAGTGCVQRQETYDYNNRLQPVMLRLGTAGSQAANACLVYNYYSTTAPTSCAIPSQASSGNNGNVQSYFFQDNTSSPTPNVGHSATYTYDTLNRLGNSTATGNQSHNLTFTNDRYGNPTCSGTGLCTSLSYSASTNRITAVGGVSVSYDAAGNMLTDATAPTSCSFTWDGENRLVSVSGCATASYVYNALGQRVEKLVGTAYTEYAFDLQGQVVAHHNRTSWQRHIIPLGSRPLARYQDSVTYFLHTNHLGSTSFVTDHAGATIQKSIYYPYGQLWQSTTTVKDERFASLNERDAETTLDPTLFRNHHSRLYRWLSPDPLAGSISNPQSLNRYAYVLNNPCNLTDPLGLTACDITIVCISSQTYTYGDPSGRSGGCSVTVTCTGDGPDVGRGPTGGRGGGGGGTGVGTPTKSKECAAKRITQGVVGAANLAIGTGKLAIAAGSAAAIPATGGLSTAGVAYGYVSGSGNLAAGVIQLFGAASGKVSGADRGAQAVQSATSILGLSTLVWKRDLKLASDAAGFESLGTAGVGGGLAGRLVEGILEKSQFALDILELAGVTEVECQ